MTTLVLLDTNTYLRLAKRLRPLVGRKFGQKDYEITILKAVEDEVNRSARLKYLNPWFDETDLAQERIAKQVRLSVDEKAEIGAVVSVLRSHVIENIASFSVGKRSPPGATDCWLLGFAQLRNAIVVTDDLGMHQLATDFDLQIWHAYELVEKLRSAKEVDGTFIREIYEALEANQDLTQSWIDAKHRVFIKVFGNPSR